MPEHDPIPELKRALGAELASAVGQFQADDAGSWLGTDRSRIADLRQGRLTRFSLETLIRFLTRIGYRVDVQVTKIPRLRV